jgi:hypothetical protein
MKRVQGKKCQEVAEAEAGTEVVVAAAATEASVVAAEAAAAAGSVPVLHAVVAVVVVVVEKDGALTVDPVEVADVAVLGAATATTIIKPLRTGDPSFLSHPQSAQLSGLLAAAQ